MKKMLESNPDYQALILRVYSDKANGMIVREGDDLWLVGPGNERRKFEINYDGMKEDAEYYGLLKQDKAPYPVILVIKKEGDFGDNLKEAIQVLINADKEFKAVISAGVDLSAYIQEAQKASAEKEDVLKNKWLLEASDMDETINKVVNQGKALVNDLSDKAKADFKRLRGLENLPEEITLADLKVMIESAKDSQEISANIKRLLEFNFSDKFLKQVDQEGFILLDKVSEQDKKALERWIKIDEGFKKVTLGHLGQVVQGIREAEANVKKGRDILVKKCGLKEQAVDAALRQAGGEGIFAEDKKAMSDNTQLVKEWLEKEDKDFELTVKELNEMLGKEMPVAKAIKVLEENKEVSVRGIFRNKNLEEALKVTLKLRGLEKEINKANLNDLKEDLEARPGNENKGFVEMVLEGLGR